MKIGILGFAHVHADRYAAAIRRTPGLELICIHDHNKSLAEAAAHRHDVPAISDLDAFFYTGIEGILICSENSLHSKYVSIGLSANVHILCEKPLALTVSDCREMVSAAKSRNLTLKVAMTTRFSPASRALRDQILQGKLGKVLMMNGRNRGKNPGGWFIDPELAGGGSMTDHIVHLLDWARWTTGFEPIRVYAESGNIFSDIPVEDAALVQVEFSEGAVLTIDASWSRPDSWPTWGDNVMEVVGTEGEGRYDTGEQSVVHYGESNEGVRHLPYGDDSSVAMILDFAAAADGLPSEGANAFDGLVAQAVTVAAYRAAAEGHSVNIDLQEDVIWERKD